MKRRQLADPVVAADRRRPSSLVDVDHIMRPQHRDVDRLAHLDGQPLADLAALLGDVELSGHRIGQPKDAEPEPVFSPLMRLLDQLVLLERGEQPRHRGLVHADVGREVCHPGFTEASEDLQDGNRAVNRLHTPAAGVGAPVAHRRDHYPGSSASL